MRLARAFLVFSYGLFTIAAQSLLFREFLTTFEGNDISVGIFFGSWFLWVAAAAASVNSSKRLAEWLTRNLELLFVLYLPAFVAQFTLIVEARELAGLESYALWSVRAILAVSMVVNAPLSIITGLLFPAACRWVRQDGTQAVAHVYVVEGLGSFAGGLGVTVLLWLGASPAQIFLILGLVVSLSVSVVRLAVVFQRPGGFTAAACGLACLGAAVFGSTCGWRNGASSWSQAAWQGLSRRRRPNTSMAHTATSGSLSERVAYAKPCRTRRPPAERPLLRSARTRTPSQCWSSVRDWACASGSSNCPRSRASPGCTPTANMPCA